MDTFTMLSQQQYLQAVHQVPHRAYHLGPTMSTSHMAHHMGLLGQPGAVPQPQSGLAPGLQRPQSQLAVDNGSGVAPPSHGSPMQHIQGSSPGMMHGGGLISELSLAVHFADLNAALYAAELDSRAASAADLLDMAGGRHPSAAFNQAMMSMGGGMVGAGDPAAYPAGLGPISPGAPSGPGTGPGIAPVSPSVKSSASASILSALGGGAGRDATPPSAPLTPRQLSPAVAPGMAPVRGDSAFAFTTLALAEPAPPPAVLMSVALPAADACYPAPLSPCGTPTSMSRPPSLVLGKGGGMAGPGGPGGGGGGGERSGMCSPLAAPSPRSSGASSAILRMMGLPAPAEGDVAEGAAGREAGGAEAGTGTPDVVEDDDAGTEEFLATGGLVPPPGTSLRRLMIARSNSARTAAANKGESSAATSPCAASSGTTAPPGSPAPDTPRCGPPSPMQAARRANSFREPAGSPGTNSAAGSGGLSSPRGLRSASCRLLPTSARSPSPSPVRATFAAVTTGSSASAEAVDASATRVIVAPLPVPLPPAAHARAPSPSVAAMDPSALGVVAPAGQLLPGPGLPSPRRSVRAPSPRPLPPVAPVGARAGCVPGPGLAPGLAPGLLRDLALQRQESISGTDHIATRCANELLSGLMD